MPNLIKSTCEACECSYTCGLSLRKCLRLLSVIGMLSSVVYIGVGAYIIVHIVQTEKVEWFPNSYYSITRNGPTASRIVVPPPLRPIPQSNTVEDFGIHHPPQTPFQQNAIFPVGDEQDKESTNNLLEDGNERAIYYRKHVGLFICLAATLILINFIQLFTDICLFHSTLKGKRSTSFWVFFLLDVILWIMTLICFITIFSGGGIFLLLVFLVGTTIRVYIVYVLHELMSDLRKPRAWSSTTGSEVQPEPRSVVDAENGGDDDDKEGDNNADEDAPQEDGDGGSTTSSTKSLQPPQVEDEGEEDALVVEAQEEEIQTEDIGETDNGTGLENEELKMAQDEQDGEGEADLDPDGEENADGGEEGELGESAGEDEPETEEASPENPEDAAVDPDPEGEEPEGDAGEEQPAEEEPTGEEPDVKDSAEGPEEEETMEQEPAVDETATEEVVEENALEIPEEDVPNEEVENPSERNEEDGSTNSNEAEADEKEPGNADIEDNQQVEGTDPALEENESNGSEPALENENPGSHNSIDVGNSENEPSELPPGQENTETSEKAEETEESQADLESEEGKADESEEVNEMDSGNAEEQPTQAEEEKNANPQIESKKKRKKSKRKRKNKNP